LVLVELVLLQIQELVHIPETLHALVEFIPLAAEAVENMAQVAHLVTMEVQVVVDLIHTVLDLDL
jgi:hypothetical protein